MGMAQAVHEVRRMISAIAFIVVVLAACLAVAMIILGAFEN